MLEKLRKFCKTYEILEIFENFEKILRNFEQILKKFFEISLLAYSFSNKLSKSLFIRGGGHVPPKVKVKTNCFLGVGGARAPSMPLRPPMFDTIKMKGNDNKESRIRDLKFKS